MARRQQPGDGRRHQPGRQQEHHRQQHARSPASRPAPSAPPAGAPGPASSPPARRDRSRRTSSAFQVPCSSSVSPACSDALLAAVVEVLALALHGENDRGRRSRSPCRGTPSAPTSPERGGIITSARPELRLNSVSSTSAGGVLVAEGEMLVGGEGGRRLGVAARRAGIALGQSGRRSGRADRLLHRDELQAADSGRGRRAAGGLPTRARSRARAAGTCRRQPVLLDQRARMAAEIGRHGAPLRFGSRRWPNSTMIAIVPPAAARRRGRIRRSRSRRRPASAAASDTSTLTGVPVSASSEPAWAEKTSGISSCDGARFSRTAMTTTTGSSAATAPLTLISAVSSATSRPSQHQQARPAFLARPARSAAGPPRR